MAFLDQKLELLREQIFQSDNPQGFGHSWPGMEPPTYYYGNHNSFHRGVDYVPYDTWHNRPGGLGTDIRSPATGKVIFKGVTTLGNTYEYVGNLGKTTVIQAADGYKYIIGHQQDWINQDSKTGQPIDGQEIMQGDWVKAGDLIGHVGSTGASSGPHVHLEVHSPHPTAQNPIGLVNFSQQPNQPQDLFYKVYHGLGFGAGDNPGHAFSDAPPDPGQLLPDAPILPLGDASGHDPINDPPNTPPDPSGGNGGGTGGNGGNGGGNIINYNNGAGMPSLIDVLPAIIGLFLIWHGLRSLQSNKPIRVITEPVQQGINSTKDTSQKIATAINAGKAAAPRVAAEAAAI